MLYTLVETDAWLLTALSVSIAAIIYLVALHSFRRLSHKKSPPVAPRSILETIRAVSGPDCPFFMREMAEATNSLVYKLNLPIPGGAYLVGTSAAQREVFMDKTTDKSSMYSIFDKISGTPSILTRQTVDPIWVAARKKSAPAFSSMEVSRMNRICSKHVELWIERTLKPTIEKGEAFDPSQEMIKLAFNSIFESTFEYEPSDEERKRFLQHLEVALREFSFKQTVNPIRKVFGSWLFPGTREAIRSCVACREFAANVLEAYRSNPNKSPNKTLIKLIESNPLYNDDMKISDLLIYMTAGFDTTGYTLGNTLVLLAKYPDVCKKAAMSIDKQTLKPSSYLQQVEMECNRMMPVGAMGSTRLAGRDFAFPATHNKQDVLHVPKGASLFMPQIVPNFDPSVYAPDPEIFRPERWENATKEMALLTFGSGNRNCIGQSLAMAEINSVLPRLLSEYGFEIVEEGKVDFFLTLKYSGFKIKAFPWAAQ